MKISMSFLYGLVEAISRLKECSFGATAEIILHLQIGKVTSQITLNQWKTVYKWLHSPENGMIGLVVTTPILYVKRVFSKKQMMSLKGSLITYAYSLDCLDSRQLYMMEKIRNC